MALRARWVIAVVALSACNRSSGGGSLLGNAARKSNAPLMSVPYIVGDPVPNPPVRPTLARTPWVMIHGRHVVSASRESSVDGPRKPAQWVWLIGADGPCRATLEDRDDTGGYPLVGCPGVGWAPAAILAQQMPADVQWVPAQTLVDVELGPQQRWEHALAEHARWPDESSGRAPLAKVWAQTVPGVQRQPTQIAVSLAWPHETDPCQDSTKTTVTDGWWTAQSFDPDAPPIESHDVPILLGAVVQGEEAQALIYRDRVDVWLAVTPASAEDRPDLPPEVDRGPQEWTVLELVDSTVDEATAARTTYRVTEPCANP